jgi:hypothetical protein
METLTDKSLAEFRARNALTSCANRQELTPPTSGKFDDRDADLIPLIIKLAPPENEEPESL